MEQQLFEIDCDPECGFVVRSHDRDEVKKFAKEHVKMVHSKDTSDKELEEMVQMA
jgi:predicted small metal-binding protein